MSLKDIFRIRKAKSRIFNKAFLPEEVEDINSRCLLIESFSDLEKQVNMKIHDLLVEVGILKRPVNANILIIKADERNYNRLMEDCRDHSIYDPSYHRRSLSELYNSDSFKKDYASSRMRLDIEINTAYLEIVIGDHHTSTMKTKKYKLAKSICFYVVRLFKIKNTPRDLELRNDPYNILRHHMSRYQSNHYTLQQSKETTKTYPLIIESIKDDFKKMVDGYKRERRTEYEEEQIKRFYKHSLKEAHTKILKDSSTQIALESKCREILYNKRTKLEEQIEILKAEVDEVTESISNHQTKLYNLSNNKVDEAVSQMNLVLSTNKDSWVEDLTDFVANSSYFMRHETDEDRREILLKNFKRRCSNDHFNYLINQVEKSSGLDQMLENIFRGDDYES